MPIPNSYHFIDFGRCPDQSSASFSFINYLAIISCIQTNRPDFISFHCDEEPSGIWWERARPYLTVVPRRPPVRLFGIPLTHPAHQADVARLQILRDKGGIYLDLDVLCLRPFAPLLQSTVVMGEEYGVGLCNAVILASRGAAFVKCWIDCYRNFNAEDWNQHSVRVPARLAKSFPKEVRVLDCRKFYWPMYWKEHLDAFFLRPGSSFCSDSYCVHLWATLSQGYLREVTPETVWERDSEFCMLARRFIDRGTARRFPRPA